jgi:hypothetical protein
MPAPLRRAASEAQSSASSAPVEEGAAPRRGVGQEDTDLLILAPPRRAAVLAGHPSRLGPLLEKRSRRR